MSEPKSVDDYKIRLKNRIHRISDEGCWLIWEKNKYSSFSYEGKTITIHRASYQIFNGIKITKKKMCVCHICNNKACINPEHLYLGSYSQNSMDCINAGNHFNKSKKFCQKGHEFTEFNTLFRNIGLRNKYRYRLCRICKQEANKKRYL